MPSVDRAGREGGAILMLAMVFTAMLALLSASVLRVVVMELRMAGNEAARQASFQYAEAIVSAIVRREAFFPTDTLPGLVYCKSGDTDSPCPELVFSETPGEPPGVYPGVSYSLSRPEPAAMARFPLRESENRASGSGHFSALLFDVSVEVMGTGHRGGAVRIVQGVAVRVLAAEQ